MRTGTAPERALRHRAVHYLAAKSHLHGIRTRPRLLGRPLVYWFRDRPNFGDALAPLLSEWVFGRRPLWCNPRASAKLLLVGSVIDWIRPGDTVWGSGLLADRQVSIPPDVDLIALRGTLTAERCGLDPATLPLGDPALLVPHIVPRTATDDGRTLIITHYVDRSVDLGPIGSHIDVVSASDPVDVVVDRIQRARHVVSSSLHGIICAEAYGVPSTHVVLSDRVFGGSFKFRDYYAGTGREYPGGLSIGNALERAAEHHEQPDLSAMVDRLLASTDRLRSRLRGRDPQERG